MEAIAAVFCLGRETAPVSLVDELRRAMDNRSVSLLVVLDLSMTFNTTDFLLGHFSVLPSPLLSYAGATPS